MCLQKNAQDVADKHFSRLVNGLKILLAPGLELPCDNHALIGEHGLAGHPRVGIPGQKRIQNAVRNPVGQLVRVSLGNGLGCEKMGFVKTSGGHGAHLLRSW